MIRCMDIIICFSLFLASSATADLYKTNPQDISNKQTNAINESLATDLLAKFDKSNYEVMNYVNEKITDKSKYIGRTEELTASNIKYEKLLRDSAQLDNSSIDIIMDGLSIKPMHDITDYDNNNVDKRRWYKYNDKTLVAIEPIIGDGKYLRYYTLTDCTKLDNKQINAFSKLFKKKINGANKLVTITDVVPADSSAQMIHIKEIASLIIDAKGQLIAYKAQARSRFRPVLYEEETVFINPANIDTNTETTKITKIRYVTNQILLNMPSDNLLWLTCSNIRLHGNGNVTVLRNLEFILNGNKNAVFDHEHPDKLYSLTIADDKFKLIRSQNNKYGPHTIEINRNNGKLDGIFISANGSKRSKVTGICKAL